MNTTIKCTACQRVLEIGEEYVEKEMLCRACYEAKMFPTEIYSRVVGYIRPVKQWNVGKQEEFKDRKEFKVTQA